MLNVTWIELRLLLLHIDILTLLLSDFFALEFDLCWLFTGVVWSVIFIEEPLCSPRVLDLENPVGAPVLRNHKLLKRMVLAS